MARDWLRELFGRTQKSTKHLPVRRPRRTRLLVEPLESRCVPATLMTPVSFNSTNGSYPYGGVIEDGSGNLFGTTYEGGASGYGTVFEVQKGSGTITTLATFNNTDGSYPLGGVIEDSSGNLFGTTSEGGASSYGTVFEVQNGSGTITTLATFNKTNGSYPESGVVEDGSGNLFGTTYEGGASGYGMVFEVQEGSGTITTLATFNNTNGSYPYGGVALDSSGNLFGTTYEGGASGYGTVFEVQRGSGTITTLATFNNTNGSYPVGGVIEDSSGNLFSTTSEGGASSYGTVFEVQNGSGTITTLATFNNTNGSYPYGSMALDSSGNLFGTTYEGGASSVGTVFEVQNGSGTITTLVTFNNTNGSYPLGGVIEDSSGNLFGTTYEGGASGVGTVFEVQLVDITTPSLPNWTVNQAGYNQTLSASGGTGSFTFTSSGTLPPGLTLSTSGVLSGTPTAAGSYNFTVTATDTASATTSQAYAVTINPAVSIATTTLANWTVNQAGYSQTLSASGGTGSLTYSSSGTLPPGLTLSTSGVLSGKPTTAGSYMFTVNATDTVNASASEVYEVIINPAVTIATTTLANWTVNQGGYNQTISATGGTGAVTFSSSGTLPTGLTLSSSGVLSGTPTTAGSFMFTVIATDTVNANSSQGYTVTINPAVTITTSTLANWTANQPGYNQTISASGGTGTVTFSAPGGLPPGLTLSSSGVLSGTPTLGIGLGIYLVTATDTVNASASEVYEVIINPAVTIATTTLANWTVNQPGYNQTISASGGTGSLTYSSSGTLPPGLTLSSSGVLSGKPTTAGSYMFTVNATDTVNASAGQNYTVAINPAVTIATTTLANWTVNQGGYNQTISATGGTGAVTFSTSGTLPNGLTLSTSGVLSGTPTTAGSFMFTVQATDTVNASASQGYTVTINSALTITTTTLANGTVNQPGYNQTISASGGTGAVTFSSTGTLPAGLTLSSSGVLSGTPTFAGSYTFTVKATDSVGASASLTFTNTISGVNDFGFETPVAGIGGFQYNAVGSPWTFNSSAGVAGNGNAFTSGNPNAPQGSQVAFLQGAGSAGQGVTLTAGTYDIAFTAAQRGNFQASAQTFEVLVDGNVVSSFNNLVGTGYTPLTTSSFTVTTGSHIVTFQATDLHGGDNTVFLDQVVSHLLPTNLNDSGFETPVTGIGGIQYNPASSPWTFNGSAGVTANASAFTNGNPNTPQGSQVAFLQGVGSVSQGVTFLAGGGCEIAFSAAQRGNVQASTQTFEVLVDGNVVSSYNSLVGTNYATLTTSSFTVTAGKHTIAFQGTDLHGGDNTVFIDQVMIILQATNLNDSGFETPVTGLGGIQYNPASSPWTFNGSAGVTANASAFTNGNPNTPQGSQVAFVQGVGSVSQNVTFSAASYDIVFSAAQRGNVQASTQTFEVLVDGNVVSTFNSLTGTSYTTLTTSSFTVSSGSHLITILGTDLHGGDNTVFLDQITINPVG